MPLMIGNNAYKVVTTQKASDAYDLDTYLNFYMPFGGTITLRRVGSPTVVELEYSTDGGTTWTIWEEVDTDRTLTLPVEGRMWIRNISTTSTGFSTTENNYYNFNADNPIAVGGNVNSLLCKNPQNAVNSSSFIFSCLFRNNTHLYALLDTFKLPFTTMNRRTYNLFFDGCTSLMRVGDAFNLPSPSLAEACYVGFFRNTKVNRVVTYMTDISALSCLVQWLSVVPPTGDLYCDPSLTLPTGGSGIPDGWTRHDLSELNN